MVDASAALFLGPLVPPLSEQLRDRHPTVDLSRFDRLHDAMNALLLFGLITSKQYDMCAAKLLKQLSKSINKQEGRK